MHEHSTNTITIQSTLENVPELFPKVEFEEYATLLMGFGAEYKESQYYWRVGKIEKTQGWIIHLSVIATQITDLANLVVPFLIKANIPFKIARNRSLAEKLINGNYGAKHLGKVVCIYPATDEQVGDLARELMQMTKDFKGPAIPTDFCLQNIVYTRYGSFSPIWINDDKGWPVEHIYNEKQELIPDPYHIPFSCPPGVSWPFYHITDPVIPIQPKLLNSRYYLISTIKSDFRGNVYKAIYFNKLWSIKACVLKQARKNTNSDEDGRDNSHRLLWQFELSQQLTGVIPLPKAFDTFVENGDTFLAIEFVSGKSLHDWLSAIYQDRTWFELEFNQQQEILDICVQIIDIVAAMHTNGLLHRDIAPANFIVTKRNRVIPIDLELAWSYTEKMPSPPFALGTPGYMSPQQAERELPSVKDDIYSLGGLLLKSFTNLNPTKISSTDPILLRSHLNFFTNNDQISDSIADCLQLDPTSRPEFEILKQSLLSLTNRGDTSRENRSAVNTVQLEHSRLQETIQAALDGLTNSKMLSPKGCWVSMQKDRPNSEKQEFDYSQGWHTGMSGPLWLLAHAKMAGFDVDRCKSTFVINWEYIHAHYFKNPASSNPSLYYGGAGIATALSAGLNSGLLPANPENISRLKECFSITALEPSLSSGVSGQGLALMDAVTWLDRDFSTELLESYISFLSDAQKPNGSWDMGSLGMENGVAGILWFLLVYLRYHADLRVSAMVDRGLNWLITAKVNKRIWKRIQTTPNRGWCNGQSSVDLTILMIRSYEITGNARYKDIAERNLKTVPPFLLSPNFTLDNGLARLGQLFLTAYRVLRSDEWIIKANWIAGVFQHTLIPINGTDGFWHASNDLNVTADLYSGNSGVINFLIEYYQNIVHNQGIPKTCKRVGTI